jgi:L-lactate dehydrogenase complex protein LldF
VGWNEERLIMGVLAKAFRSPMAYRFGLAAARRLLGGGKGDRWIGRLPGYGSGWTKGRDFPALADESFRDWWKKRKKGVSARRSGIGGEE